MDQIEPHFFGSSERRLFGVYHVPRGRSRAHGVVLCPPGPREYMRSHMALRKLAALLAREGFHVLRFDYYGTGDSAGGSHEGTIVEWRRNIVSAADDIRECSGARTVSVVGFRLGAALAASIPIEVMNLVLWDPVVSGGRYIDELRELHRRQFAGLLYPPPLPRTGRDGDILGTPAPSSMLTGLQTIDLLVDPTTPAKRIAMVVSEQRADYSALRVRLENRASGGSSLDYHHIPTVTHGDQHEVMLVSSSVLQAMTSVLTGGTA